MKNLIGILSGPDPERGSYAPKPSNAAVKSLVEVHFPERHMTLSYLNDRFDLHRGDLVFVEGKLEGLQGYVVHVSRSFKVKASDYMRVIALADTHASGEFRSLDTCFVSFDRAALPYEKVLGWYQPPTEREEYISGDGEGPRFKLYGELPFSENTAQGGLDILREDRVLYLELDGDRCRALVRGSRVYTVEFDYQDGEVSNICCECYCPYPCKHEFAAVMKLKLLLDGIAEECSDRPRYFAACAKREFFRYVLDNDRRGTVTVG